MIVENDFRYCVDVNHYGSYSCEESGCNDEGICRCYMIDEVTINSVDITRLTQNIFDQLNTDDSQYRRDKKITSLIYNYDSDMINKYCIHRILTHRKVWDVDNWKSEIIGGYYGQEVGDVLIKKELFDKVNDDIKNIYQLDTLEDKINYVLKLEYGYILDQIKDRKYEVISIDKEDLEFGQSNHHKNILHKKIDYYSDKKYLENSVRGIAYWQSGKWRVVDGYHRLTETKFPKVRIIGIK
jgi:hypothetical protein